MRTPTSRLVVLLVAALLVPLSGCRSGSALHSRYNNFRAYYNTYYNATRKLDEGERALLNVNTPIDRTVLVPLFPTGAASAGRTPAFQAAIEKSAELLRNRPSSSWADDALLVIGKAFFYERNLAGAEQKFRETIAAAEVNRDRRLSDEARFWLGRTLAAADRFEEGVGVLREGIERPDGARFWTARMHLGLGELYARAGRWDEAAAALREGLPDVRDADLGGRAGLLLGQAEEAAGRFESAADAYGDVVRRGPAYEIEFAARISRALVLGIDAERAPEALEDLRRMARDDKNFARRAEVAMTQGRVLAAAGERDAARTRLREVLYDPDLAGQTVRAETHVRLGELYRDAFGDFVRAAAHFDTAATALSARPVATARASRAALTGTRQTAQVFATVARASTRIESLDSLLALGRLDDDAFRVRIEEIEAQRRAAWLVEQRQIEALQTEQQFGGGGALQTGRPGVGGSFGTDAPGTRGAPVGAAAAAGGASVGFLGFRDPRTVLTGQVSFRRVWGDRPLVPNWRRAAAVRTAGAGIDGVAGGVVASAATGLASGLGPPRLDLSGVPRSPEQQATLVSERASLRYELANAFFLSLGRADLAEGLYRQVLDETPDAPVALRARYAMGEIEAAAGRSDAASTFFRDVVSADSASTLARAARARLDGRDVEPEPDPVSTLDESAFLAARQLWDDGEPLLAANAFVRLGDADPASAIAPRAYLAAALAVVDASAGDSLALLASLPPERVPSALPRDVTVPQAQPDAPVLFDDGPATRGSERRPGAVRASSASPVPPAQTPPGAAPPDTARSTQSDPFSPDSTPPEVDMTVRDLLLALASAYPGTPVAARASALASALPASPDVLPGGEPVALAGLPLEPSTPLDSLASAEAAAPFGLLGTQPVDATLGGVTWQLTQHSSAAAARGEAASARSAGLRHAVSFDPETQSFSVVVGQFLTEDEARAALPRIPLELLEESAIVAVAALTLLPATP